MEEEKKAHGPHILHRAQAIEFYRQFLEHPELFDESGELPEQVQRSFDALENYFKEVPLGAEPAAPPVLGSVEIAIPIEDAIELLRTMGCEPFLEQNPIETIGGDMFENKENFGKALCIMKDPYGNLFILLQH